MFLRRTSLAFKKSANVKLHVSVSHDGEYTVANVLADVYLGLRYVHHPI